MSRQASSAAWHRAILLGLVVFFGCRAKGPSPASSESAVVTPLVEALPARSGSLPLEERVTGVVKAENQVAIRAEIEAIVAQVLVRSGDAVKRGQPLIRLAQDPLGQQLRQAEASVRLAKAAEQAARARVSELRAMVVRTRQLSDKAVVSALERETQEAQLAVAQASAAQAVARIDEAEAAAEERRSSLRKTVIRAPVAGRIGRCHAEVGMLVNPSTLLFMLGDLDQLVIEIPLTEKMLGHVKPRQPVRISAATLPAGPLTASLSRVSPFLVEGSFSTTGEIDLENPGGRLRPGMFVTVDVLYGESETATLVPSSAVWEDPRTGALGVFLIESNPSASQKGPAAEPQSLWRRARWRPIEVRAEGRSAVGVVGVAVGDWVVTAGQQLLGSQESQAVRVRPTTWEQVERLQSLQPEDLLVGFLEKQRRLARTLGARPPESDSFVGTGATRGASSPAAP